ncbi:MAG: hypothetical protein K6E51_08685 [Treponema sp.]|nr:hypothetical protein [Treponema sp.]
MKLPKYFYIPVAVLCAGIFCLFAFRKIPISRLWKEYTVLYVTNDVPENTILDALYANGCKDVISLSNQQLPASVQMSPVEKNLGTSSYLQKRNAYFSDKQHKFRLFYIPEFYSRQAAEAVSSLHVEYGMDAQSRFPWIAPIICILLFIFFLLVAENKIVYGIAGVFLILFTFSQPFTVNVAAVCLLLFCFYLMQKVWKRRRATLYLVHHYAVVFFGLPSVLFVFTCSVSASFLFVLALLCSASALYIFSFYEDEWNKHSVFSPVFIRSATYVPLITRKNAHYMLLCTICIALLLSTFFVSENVSSTITDDLQLPAPTRYVGDAALPSLDDYIAWNWNVVTYPYRSLNDEQSFDLVPKEDEKVLITHYKKTSQGIQAYDEVVFAFNSDFRAQVLHYIDTLKYPAIEKLLKEQGSANYATYKFASGYQLSIFNLIVIIFALLIPIFGFVLYTIFGRKKL